MQSGSFQQVIRRNASADHMLLSPSHRTRRNTIMAVRCMGGIGKPAAQLLPLLPPPHCVASSLSLPAVGLPSRDGWRGREVTGVSIIRFHVGWHNFKHLFFNSSLEILETLTDIQVSSKRRPVFPQAVIVGGSLAVLFFFSPLSSLLHFFRVS